ncbi:AraC family transcriptional regulator [Burkholderia singularis]|uniref:Transcriptional regulator, AraC family n=1 Tax=Burkholderia singularis TaxID=1503053 RepID=A0A238H2Q7_9BURK|nr:AraC family transcriptional regulator [Burkholderia singularis]SMF99539.1 Transcriptional regulator, AraC family [Burkholderia singularis]
MTTARAHWNPAFPVGRIDVLLDIGAQQGLSTRDCLAGSGVAPDGPGDPAVASTAAQELRIVRNLKRLLGPDFPLGIEIGRRYHATAYGIWGLALLSSATLGDAIATGLRHLRLTSTFCGIRPAVRGGDPALIVDDRDLPADVRDTLVEMTIAALITLQFDLDPANLPVKGIALKMRRPAYADLYAALFGAMPEFGAAQNALTVDAPCLGSKLPQSNALTWRACDDECRRMLERRSRGDDDGRGHGWAERVRSRVAGDPMPCLTMVALAAEFGMSARTLRRRLADEGTDYETIVGEMRERLAGELLVTTALPIPSVAERLGYAEPSSFARAFRRWKGVSPLAYRRSA